MENSLDSVVIKNSIKLALTRLLGGLGVISLILFISAGTLNYWNAWIFLGTLFIPIIIVFIYLIINDPALLERRMRTGEKRKSQSLIIKLSIIPFAAALMLPGLDFRNGWSEVPIWVVCMGVIIFIAGYSMFFFVLRENSYASRIIEIQEEQRVIDSGMYAFVRHPMYLSNIIIYLSMPLILGSWYAFIPMVLFLFVFYYRVKDEEDLLIHELQGYPDYIKKVKYRIIPFVW